MDKRLKGSFTLESALLMPIVFLSIFAILYLGFYLYDYNKVETLVNEALHKGAMYMKHESDFHTGDISYEKINCHPLWEYYNGDLPLQESKLNTYLEEEMSRFLLFEGVQVSTEVDLAQIHIKVLCKIHRTLPFTDFIFQDFLIEGTSSIHYPAQTIRQGEIMITTGKKIKGVEEFLAKIEKVLK